MKPVFWFSRDVFPLKWKNRANRYIVYQYGSYKPILDPPEISLYTIFRTRRPGPRRLSNKVSNHLKRSVSQQTNMTFQVSYNWWTPSFVYLWTMNANRVDFRVCVQTLRGNQPIPGRFLFYFTVPPTGCYTGSVQRKLWWVEIGLLLLLFRWSPSCF